MTYADKQEQVTPKIKRIKNRIEKEIREICGVEEEVRWIRIEGETRTAI